MAGSIITMLIVVNFLRVLLKPISQEVYFFQYLPVLIIADIKTRNNNKCAYKNLRISYRKNTVQEFTTEQ